MNFNLKNFHVNIFEAFYMPLLEFLDISYSGIKLVDLRQCHSLKKILYDISQKVIVNTNVEFEVVSAAATIGVHDTK